MDAVEYCVPSTVWLRFDGDGRAHQDQDPSFIWMEPTHTAEAALRQMRRWIGCLNNSRKRHGIEERREGSTRVGEVYLFVLDPRAHALEGPGTASA